MPAVYILRMEWFPVYMCLLIGILMLLHPAIVVILDFREAFSSGIDPAANTKASESPEQQR
jgi:hypothetical protein